MRDCWNAGVLKCGNVKQRHYALLCSANAKAEANAEAEAETKLKLSLKSEA